MDLQFLQQNKITRLYPLLIIEVFVNFMALKGALYNSFALSQNVSPDQTHIFQDMFAKRAWIFPFFATQTNIFGFFCYRILLKISTKSTSIFCFARFFGLMCLMDVFCMGLAQLIVSFYGNSIIYFVSVVSLVLWLYLYARVSFVLPLLAIGAPLKIKDMLFLSKSIFIKTISVLGGLTLSINIICIGTSYIMNQDSQITFFLEAIIRSIGNICFYYINASLLKEALKKI